MEHIFPWLASAGIALTSWGARKGLVVTAYTTAFFGVLTIYLACITFIHESLQMIDLATASGAVRVGGPAVDFLGAVAMFVPENASNCMVLILNAFICRAAYILVIRYINNVTSAS